MKTLFISRPALVTVACLLVVPMSAFTLRGGEGFEIYVGRTLAIQQFLNIDKAVKTLDLSTAAATDQLRVTYNHCGQTGSNRILKLKDKDLVLKEWKFANLKEGGTVRMNIPVKDIAAIQKTLKDKQLSLFYSSDLLKEGRALVTLTALTTQVSMK